MLKIENLHAFYGKSHVLHGVSFDINSGEIVSLLGRNGSGRSTTAKSIMGLVECKGSITWNGQAIVDKKAYQIAHLGIGYVPENRDIFPKLTVHQNLILGQKGKGEGSRWNFDDMYDMFPRLKDRQHTEAGVLSGGEQQMLAISRALMSDPKILLLDEPSLGLAPLIIQSIFKTIRQLRDDGLTIILVEQNFRFAAPIADRHYLMEHGHIVEQIHAHELAEKTELLNTYLGV